MTFSDRPWYGSVSKPKQPFPPQVAFGSGAVDHSNRNLTKTIVNPWGSGSTVAENPLFISLPPLFVLLVKGVCGDWEASLGSCFVASAMHEGSQIELILGCHLLGHGSHMLVSVSTESLGHVIICTSSHS